MLALPQNFPKVREHKKPKFNSYDRNRKAGQSSGVDIIYAAAYMR